jgi:hypothetical protein
LIMIPQCAPFRLHMLAVCQLKRVISAEGLLNIIIMMIIVRTGDIRAFIAPWALGMMIPGAMSARLEDVCRQFPANT